MRGAWLLSALVLIAVVTVAVVALLFTWDRALPKMTHAAGPAMSLTAPGVVFVGESFVLFVNADPAPDVEFVGFGSEVIFPEGLVWEQRASCLDELQVGRADGGAIALCSSSVPVLTGGAAHAVLSEFALPAAALDVALGSTTPLVELDFVCNTQGSYKLILTAVPESFDGAVYAALDGGEIKVKTTAQNYDADGDTTPESHQVADTILINCIDQPTPTPTATPTVTPTPTATPTVTPPPPKIDTDGDGCLDNRENGPDETLGGRRDPLNFWDFFDPNRDKSVTLLDFFAILRHFGTVGDPATLDPDGPEPPIGEYWASADRGGQAPGGDPWDELPANGSIGLGDVFSLLRQFGHTCA